LERCVVERWADCAEARTERSPWRLALEGKRLRTTIIDAGL
jgi:hypothetical protein